MAGPTPQTTTSKPGIDLRGKSIWQIRKMYRRAIRRYAAANSRLAWAKTPSLEKRYSLQKLYYDWMIGSILVELDRRGVPLPGGKSCQMRSADELQKDSEGEIVFVWRPVRLCERDEDGTFYSTGKWALFKRVRKYRAGDETYYCAL